MTRDPLPHWPRCPRRLVLPRKHPDGRRTLACWSCGAFITYAPDWTPITRHTPDRPPAWTNIPEENR